MPKLQVLRYKDKGKGKVVPVHRESSPQEDLVLLPQWCALL